MWGECDLRLAPTGSDLILRHHSFAEAKYLEDEHWVTLEKFLQRIQPTGKCVKFDLKTGGSLFKLMQVYLGEYPLFQWTDSGSTETSSTCMKKDSLGLPKGFPVLSSRHP